MSEDIINEISKMRAANNVLWMALLGIALKSERVLTKDVLRQINGAGGIKGATVHLVIDNDDSQPAQSAVVMASLITSQNVLAVLGPQRDAAG